MGIFSSITNETKRNFIARPDEARKDIIYKYPEHNIRTLTQLTCQPDEMAIFVKGGKVEGKLGPGGTYSLDSNNLPFLGSLLDKLTGGNLFIAEIYFVSTREVPSIRFGGPLGEITDNVTQLMCQAMVYGDFSVRVSDPEKLLFGLVGSGSAAQTGNGFLDWFKKKLLKYISNALGKLSDQGWSINKMISPGNKLELQDAVLEQVRKEVDGSGLQIVQFGDFVLSIDDEAKEELNKLNKEIAHNKRHMEQARDPAYTTVAQAEMMRNAGVGMAKGGGASSGAMTGLGLGMGMQMAQSFGQQTQQQQPRAPQSQTPVVTCASCNNATPVGKFCTHCGKPIAQAVKCECGVELVPGAKFCTSCGKPVQAGPKKCECGTELASGAKFCTNCGKGVG